MNEQITSIFIDHGSLSTAIDSWISELKIQNIHMKTLKTTITPLPLNTCHRQNELRKEHAVYMYQITVHLISAFTFC